MKYFSKSPFDPGKVLKVKMFIEFLVYKNKEVIINKNGY